jgi:hypothetical protein
MIHPPGSCPHCHSTATVILGSSPIVAAWCPECGVSGPRAENEERANELFSALGAQPIYTEWVAVADDQGAFTFELRHLIPTELIYYSYDLFPDGEILRTALMRDPEKEERIKVYKPQE